MHYWLIRTRLLFVLSFAAGVIALPSGDRAEAQTAPDPVPLGVNLAFFKDWSTELPLVDVFHSSREWIPSAIGSAEWDSGVAVPTDANGWPLEIPYDNGGNPPQIVKTRVLHAQMTPYPTGAYTLIFEGDGVVTLDLDAFGVFEGGGSYPFQVTTPTDEGLLLTIERSNPADPVRNIHVILPGHANTWQTQPFNPLFLDAISPFSVLRFMDWIGVLFEDEFPRGRGKFVAVEQGPPAAELPSRRFPFTLITGRSLYHWHGGVITRRVPGLLATVPVVAVDMHPEDAERLDLSDGDAVQLASRRGEIIAEVHVGDRMQRGELFVPFVQLEGAAANFLTNDQLDAAAGIPEYKACAVRLEAPGTPSRKGRGPRMQRKGAAAIGDRP